MNFGNMRCNLVKSKPRGPTLEGKIHKLLLGGRSTPKYIWTSITLHIIFYNHKDAATRSHTQGGGSTDSKWVSPTCHKVPHSQRCCHKVQHSMQGSMQKRTTSSDLGGHMDSWTTLFTPFPLKVLSFIQYIR